MDELWGKGRGSQDYLEVGQLHHSLRREVVEGWGGLELDFCLENFKFEMPILMGA